MDWAFSLKHLDMPPGLFFQSSGAQGQPINIARSLFVSQALQKNAKYIFFLDSDVEIPHDGLVKLYNAKRPVVAGVYCGRAPPYALSANVNRRPLTIDALTQYPDRLVDVHEVGMGLCLIDIRVIKRMTEMLKMEWRCMREHRQELGVKTAPDITTPAEVATYTNEQAKALGWKCQFCKGSLISDFFNYTIGTELVNKYGPMSEDYYFCNKARQCGFPIAIHTGVFGFHELPAMKITREGLFNPVTSAMEI
jgi:hypothetical protein